MVERQVRNLKVRGSTPLCSTRGSAGKADPRSILDGACPRALRRCASAPSRPRSLLYSRPCGAQAAFRLCRHQPLLSLPPTSLSLPPTTYVTATNLFYPDYPLPPQSPAAACRSTDADFCTSRLYHRPGFSTQKAPHHPEYHPATSGCRLNSVSAPHQPA